MPRPSASPSPAAEPRGPAPAGGGWETGGRAASRTGLLISATLLAVAAAVIAAAGPAAQRIFSRDAFIPLDGAWRIAQGQRPHADFNCPAGSLWLTPAAVLLDLQGPSASVLSGAAAFWTFVLGIWARRVADGRLSPARAAFLAVSVGLLAGGAHNLGGWWGNSTYAMGYNRLGFALTAILLTALFPPRHAGDRDRSAVDVGLALGALLLGKLSFFLVGAAAVSVALWVRPPTRSWLLRAGAGLATVMVPFAVWMRLDLPSVAADTNLVAGAQNWSARLRGIAAVAGDNIGMIGLAGLAAATTFGGAGGFVSRLRRPAALLGAVAAGVGLCGTNFQREAIPLLPLAGLLAAEFLSRSPPPRFAGARRAAVAVATAILWIPCTVADGLGIVSAAAWKFSAAADVPDAERFGAAPLYDLIILPTESRRGRENLDWRDAVNEGLALLHRHAGPGDRVGAVDFVNPFSFALALPPPAGALWWDAGKTFSPDVHPTGERAWGDCTLLMVPLDFDGSGQPARDALLAIYGQFFSQHFEPLAESPRWRLLRRRAGG